jgi:Mg2+/Co2+ transporter CorC
VGGYLTHLIGHLPRAGEKAVIEDFEITATKTDQRRVLQACIRRLPARESAAEGE